MKSYKMRYDVSGHYTNSNPLLFLDTSCHLKEINNIQKKLAKRFTGTS